MGFGPLIPPWTDLKGCEIEKGRSLVGGAALITLLDSLAMALIMIAALINDQILPSVPKMAKPWSSL